MTSVNAIPDPNVWWSQHNPETYARLESVARELESLDDVLSTFRRDFRIPGPDAAPTLVYEDESERAK